MTDVKERLCLEDKTWRRLCATAGGKWEVVKLQRKTAPLDPGGLVEVHWPKEGLWGKVHNLLLTDFKEDMVGKPLEYLLSPEEAKLMSIRAQTMQQLRTFADKSKSTNNEWPSDDWPATIEEWRNRNDYSRKAFGPFVTGEDAIWRPDGDDGYDISEEPNNEWDEGWNEEFRMKDNQYGKDFELFKKAIKEGRRYKANPKTGRVTSPELKHLDREDN